MPLLLAPDEAGLRRAADILRAGGLVAFPTETVYGLGARADDASAVARIYAAKGRPADNPSIVHVASVGEAERIGSFTGPARALAAAFWPGPLTLVVDRRPGAVVDGVTAGGSSVAVRVPEHPVALALLRAVGLPIAAPSANRSTHVSPTRAEHVVRSLGDSIDAVVDGGPSSRGIESTIVDVRDEASMALLRLGAIPAAEIALAVAATPLVDRSSRVDAAGIAAPAPGGQLRHYAPGGVMVVVPRDRIALQVRAARAMGAAPVGLVAAGATEDAGADVTIALPPDAAGYARGLYDALHRLEEAGCATLVVERVPDDGDWAAVRDRLRRASVPAAP